MQTRIPPAYRGKPCRRIPGTECVAVTTHASADRSVREYAILSAEGETLGRVAYHSGHIGLSAGYHEGFGVYDRTRRTWRNLTDAARTFAAEVTK